LLVNVALFRILNSNKGTWKSLGFARKIAIRITLLIGIPILWSVYLMPDVSALSRDIDVVIVQPNVDPYTEKFTGTDYLQMKNFFQLARDKMDDDVILVVGPETVYPSGIWEERLDINSIPLISNFRDSFPKTSVLLGATTYRRYKNDKSKSNTSRPLGRGAYYDVYNSSLFFDVQNQVNYSQKGKLVPGAEMMPFANFLSPLKDAMLDFGGTSGSLGSPDSIRVFKQSPGYVLASAICYESVCGEYLAEMVAKGANVIAVITNDGWWGDTQGYQQHMSYASLRAIENRRSVVRSANTGISGFIDITGRVSKKLTWNKSGAIRSKVKLNDYLTFYTTHGDYLGRLASFLAIALMLFALVKSRSEKNISR
jgi:apolipoprotein N-acyltransferase